MLMKDERIFGFVKKHKYRCRSLKEHDYMDDALFKINSDLSACPQKAQLLRQSTISSLRPTTSGFASTSQTDWFCY